MVHSQPPFCPGCCFWTTTRSCQSWAVSSCPWSHITGWSLTALCSTPHHTTPSAPRPLPAQPHGCVEEFTWEYMLLLFFVLLLLLAFLLLAVGHFGGGHRR